MPAKTIAVGLVGGKTLFIEVYKDQTFLVHKKDEPLEKMLGNEIGNGSFKKVTGEISFTFKSNEVDEYTSNLVAALIADETR